MKGYEPTAKIRLWDGKGLVKQSLRVCCGNFVACLEPGTDGEGYGSLVYLNPSSCEWEVERISRDEEA